MFPGFLAVVAKVFSIRTTAEAVVGLGVLAAGVTGTATVGTLPGPVRTAVAEAAGAVLPAVLPHDDYQTAPAPTITAGDPTATSVNAAPPRAEAEPSSVGEPSPQATGQQATGQQATGQQATGQQATGQQATDQQLADRQPAPPEQDLAAPAADPPPTGGPAAGPLDAEASSVAPLSSAAVGTDTATGSVSVAFLDTTTGVQHASGATSGMLSGSIAKLLILEGCLLSEQDAGQSPGADQGPTLAAMIEHSDNDAADNLYEALGGAQGFSKAIARLDLTATDPGPDGEWGLTATNAVDQLRLLQNLVSPDGPLSPASQAYALGLMSNVEADQRWGVGAAADPGTSFANKNGWLNVYDDGGRWLVNSLGVITVHGHQVLMAVLTQHNADFAAGVQLVESIATATSSDIR